MSDRVELWRGLTLPITAQKNISADRPSTLLDFQFLYTYVLGQVQALSCILVHMAHAMHGCHLMKPEGRA